MELANQTITVILAVVLKTKPFRDVAYILPDSYV